KVVLLLFLSLIKLRVYYSPFKSILDTRLYRRAQDFILKVLR
ncbi:MAG: dolichyl-phosphate mannose synthase, partial [Metallosphaera sp.]